MKTDALKLFWSCHGQTASLAIETNMASKFPCSESNRNLLMYRRRPNWTGEGWFFYFISVYAGAPEIIVPSMSLIFTPITLETPPITNVIQLAKPHISLDWRIRRSGFRPRWGIIGARGTDVAFTSFLKDISNATKLPSKVDVGQTAFKPTTLNVGVVVTPTGKSPMHQEMKWSERHTTRQQPATTN
jgi:hypothetical protein